MNTTDFLVRKNNLHETQFRSLPQALLDDGQVRLKIERFALTANNITYAAFGEAMKYWQFYPTQLEGWGMIPVWGFATTIESAHAEIAVGEKFYGYYPMASHVTLTPTRGNPRGFADSAPQRAELNPVYNQYLRSSADAFYMPETENLQALLRPLFGTSWLIDDFFADQDFWGARTAILSSASSKTAYGTAFQMQQHKNPRKGIEVIGLTSAANLAFCQSLGCYHRVLTYEQLAQIATDTPCVYIDFAGNVELRRVIHQRFTALKYSCSIGGTHVENLGSARDLPGPRATLFFAPAQIQKRISEWGAAEFGARMVSAWQHFTHNITKLAKPAWIMAQEHHGETAIHEIYAEVLAGKNAPRIGHILIV